MLAFGELVSEISPTFSCGGPRRCSRQRYPTSSPGCVDEVDPVVAQPGVLIVGPERASLSITPREKAGTMAGGASLSPVNRSSAQDHFVIIALENGRRERRIEVRPGVDLRSARRRVSDRTSASETRESKDERAGATDIGARRTLRDQRRRSRTSFRDAARQGSAALVHHERVALRLPDDAASRARTLRHHDVPASGRAGVLGQNGSGSGALRLTGARRRRDDEGWRRAPRTSRRARVSLCPFFLLLHEQSGTCSRTAMWSLALVVALTSTSVHCCLCSPCPCCRPRS